MESVIVDKKKLYKTIISYIHTEKVKLFQKNGSVVISPISDKYSILEKSFGMFSDGRLSTEKFMNEKTPEKELEK